MKEIFITAREVNDLFLQSRGHIDHEQAVLFYAEQHGAPIVGLVRFSWKEGYWWEMEPCVFEHEEKYRIRWRVKDAN